MKKKEWITDENDKIQCPKCYRRIGSYKKQVYRCKCGSYLPAGYTISNKETRYRTDVKKFDTVSLRSKIMQTVANQVLDDFSEIRSNRSSALAGKSRMSDISTWKQHLQTQQQNIQSVMLKYNALAVNRLEVDS